MFRRQRSVTVLGGLTACLSTLSARRVEDLRTPCLICCRATLEKNAATMRERAAALGVALRPHFKTVKTLEAAAIATDGERRRITVSTLAEASFLADGGFDDILYAVPLTPDKVDDVLALHSRLERFTVMVDHADQVTALLARTELLRTPLRVVLGVDCGYHRDGCDPHDPASVALVRTLCDAAAVRFDGLYTHGGHSYGAASSAEIVAVGEAERDVTTRFAESLRASGIEVPTVGVGSTPTCSVPPPHLAGVDEWHPGNFLYYDTSQVALGSCGLESVAVRVLTRVVGHYPKSNTLLIDCGWTGASAQGKESGYGCFPLNPELRIANLKQECGEVTSVDGAPLDFRRYPIGALLRIAPHHSCASTHQHRSVNVLGADGDTVVEEWKICKGW
mmetsp:Transcript_11410/g.37689  ORF Transcript_11410/g.37689 Transcript_11410/m.37689 type:complete len:392 (-) Transcript_11410:932-2107(-)